MRKVALVAYCLFISIYLCLAWWLGITYLIVGGVLAALLGALHRSAYR